MNTTLPIHVLARAVILSHKHILLAYPQNSKREYTYLPGGHVEANEDARSALHRELIEEIGYDCRIGHFLGCLEYRFDGQQKCHNHEYNLLFLAHHEEFCYQKSVTSKEAKLCFRWVPLEKLAEAKILPEGLVRWIPLQLKRKLNTAFFSGSSV